MAKKLRKAEVMALSENAKKAIDIFEYDLRLLEDVGVALTGKRTPIRCKLSGKPYTDGKVIVTVIPSRMIISDPDDLPQKIKDDIRTQCYHEIAHIINSFDDLVPATNPKTGEVEKVPVSGAAKWEDPKGWLFKVLNTLEDSRVEKWLFKELPGTKRHFRNCVKEGWRTAAEKRKGTIEDALLTSIYLAGSGYFSVDDLLEMRLFSGLVPYRDVLEKALDEINKAKNPVDILGSCRKWLEYARSRGLFPPKITITLPPEAVKEQEQEEQDEYDSSELEIVAPQESDEESEGSEGEESEESGTSGKGSEEEETDSEEEGENTDSGDSDEEDTGGDENDSSGDLDDDQQDTDGDKEEDEESSGGKDDEEDQQDDDDEKSGGGSGESDEKDGSDEDTDDEESDKNSGGSGEDDDEDKDGADEGEDDDEDSSAGSDEGDSEYEESTDEDEGGSGKEEEEHETDPDNTPMLDKILDSIGETTFDKKDDEDTDDSKEESKDDEGISDDDLDKVEDMARSTTTWTSNGPTGDIGKVNEWKVKVRDSEFFLERTRRKGQTAEREKQDLARSTQTPIAMLIQKLRNVFIVNARHGFEGGHKQGTGIDRKRLVRVPFDPNANPFKKRTRKDKREYAVSLIIDESSSMGGSSGNSGDTKKKIEHAKEALFACSTVMDAMKVSFEITGFCTGNVQSAPVAPIYIDIFKGYEDHFTEDTKRIMATQPVAQGVTFEAVALYESIVRILKRPEKRKVIFIICDGQPYPFNQEQKEVIRELVRKHRRQITFIGIGICIAGQEYYPDKIGVSNVNELPMVLTKKLSQVLRS